MIRWLQKLKLYLNPPKEGDVYVGNPIFFVVNRPIEKILHGMKDKYGMSMWEVVPSDDAYKLTIESGSMPTYYKCKSEILVIDMSFSYKKWLVRTQSRRIGKSMFIDMILNGLIQKQK